MLGRKERLNRKRGAGSHIENFKPVTPFMNNEKKGCKRKRERKEGKKKEPTEQNANETVSLWRTCKKEEVGHDETQSNHRPGEGGEPKPTRSKFAGGEGKIPKKPN